MCVTEKTKGAFGGFYHCWSDTEHVLSLLLHNASTPHPSTLVTKNFVGGA